MDEFSRIARFLSPLATEPGAWGLRDDVAELDIPAGRKLIVTQDTLVESVHFIGDEAPSLLAQKALRVNLSDLAAKGARPYGYLLSLSLPDRCDDEWLAAFAEGLQADQAEFGLSLLGGDSTSTPGGITLTITALGTAERTVRRSGAKVGDLVFVTGTIGDAFLGLWIAQGHMPMDDFLLSRYRLPQPRLDLASDIQAHATASLDVSDGLLQDAQHLARESGVGLAIDLAAIPVSNDSADKLQLVTGGDDYEILFTAPASARAALERSTLGKSGTRVTVIGRCVDGSGVSLTEDGKPVPLPEKLGWQHRR